MSDWEKVLLTGCDYTSPDTETRRFWESLGLNASLSDAAFMRLSLGMFVQLRKVSGRDTPPENPLETASTFPGKSGSTDQESPQKDIKVPLSFPSSSLQPRDMAFLKAVLTDAGLRLLHGRLFEGMAKRGQVLPVALLPGPLDFACLDKQYLEKLRPIMADQGWWLVGKNPAWRSLLPVHDESLWEIGTLKDRLALFRGWLEENPDLAEERLWAIWEEEPLGNKLAFLSLMARRGQMPGSVLLSRLDEDLVLRQMATRMRFAAGDLIQLKTEWRACLYYSSRGIKVKLPTNCPSAWVQAGVVCRKNGLPDLGSLVGLLPPAAWLEGSDGSPSDFLTKLEEEGILAMLLPSLLGAICHYREGGWAGAIVDRWIGNGDTSDLAERYAPVLMALLSEEDAASITAKHLWQSADLLEEKSMAIACFLNPHFPWTARSSRHLYHHLLLMGEQLHPDFLPEPYPALFMVLALAGPAEIGEEDWAMVPAQGPSGNPCFAAFQRALLVRRRAEAILGLSEI